jgi:hypothetical protein
MARREHLTPWEWALLGGAAFLVLGAARGRTLTLGEMRALAADTGFPDPDLAAAVAMAESGGKAGIVIAEPHGGPSFGLWQIHQSDHPQYSPAGLLDPAYNARAAFEISKQGVDFTAWSTFNNGLHLRWMPKNGS